MPRPAAFPRRLRRARRAFTLLELAVVVAIVVITASLGVGSLREHLPRYRMVQAAKRLKADVQSLQSLATASGRQGRLRLLAAPGDCSDPEVWGGGWVLELGDRSHGSTRWDVLPLDSAEDGVDDDQSEGPVVLSEGGNAESRFTCMLPWGTLSGPLSGDRDTIVINARGYLDNPTTDLDRGYIRLALRNQAAAAQGVQDEAVLLISAAGAVRLASPTAADSSAAGSALR